MFYKNYSSKLLLLAVALTVAAITAKGLVPQKNLSLIPSDSPDANYFLMDADKGNAYWVDRNNFHFHCKFNAGDENLPCNLVFILAAENNLGVNLQQYDAINLDVSYNGDAKKIRLAIRDFDPRFSTQENSNSSKFNFINLRVQDLEKPLTIQLNEFTVADWWLSQMNLPRDQTHPDFRNAITFAIDFEGNLKASEHDVHIKKIEFVGEWITTEHWYLAIIWVWVCMGTLFATLRLTALQRATERHRNKVLKLVETNSQLQTETDKFRKLSTVDALTNAFNRHGIEQIIESIDTHTTPTVIIILDIDHFKRINDRRGHDTGDRVLQTISQLIVKNTRSNDKFGRWGGEEFLLICTHTSVAMAYALAEKLRLVIFNNVFEEDNPMSVTASFGVAAIPLGGTFKTAFKCADEALYNAKALGRNCVVIAEEDQPNS
ncbi:MAG: GGDEF domain-containing protein [Gammaproteobacteria bacterium]|nr:MAG: GGDEF domain-containing protein [Gammaproteobacteria bacterium]